RSPSEGGVLQGAARGGRGPRLALAQEVMPSLHALRFAVHRLDIQLLAVPRGQRAGQWIPALLAIGNPVGIPASQRREAGIKAFRSTFCFMDPYRAILASQNPVDAAYQRRARGQWRLARQACVFFLGQIEVHY